MRALHYPSIYWILGLTLIVGWAQASDATTESTPGEEFVATKSEVGLELVGRLPRKLGGNVGHMAVHDNRVYLVSGDVGFQVVDVSNPAAPKVVGSYRPKDHLGPVATSGDHAFVVENDNLLRVLDVSDPRSRVPSGRPNSHRKFADWPSPAGISMRR